MMRKVTLEFTSTSPLLMASPKLMAFDTGTGVTTKAKRDKKEEAEGLCYRNGDGFLYLPCDAFRGALLSACKGRKIGKLGLAGILQGAVFAIEEETVLHDPGTDKPLKTYVINESRVVNAAKKAALICARPLIDHWKCVVTFDVDDEFVPDLSLLVKMFDIAGRIIGVGAWRVEKKGRFGRFVCRLVKRDKSEIWDKKTRSAKKEKVAVG